METGQAVSGQTGSSQTPSSLLLLASNERLGHVMLVVFPPGPIQPPHVQKRLNSLQTNQPFSLQLGWLHRVLRGGSSQ